MSESRFSTRVFGVAAAALLLYLLARILRPFFGPILWALLLAILLFPVNSWLRGKLHGRRGPAALLLTFAVTLGIVIPATLLMLVFVRQAAELLARVSELAGRYQIEKPQDLLRIPAFGRLMQWIDAKTPFSAAEFQQWLVNAARSVLELAVSGGRSVLLGAVGAVVGLLLMLFILYFFFRDGDEMALRMLRLVPLEDSRKGRLVAHLSDVMKAVVFGALATALVQGGLVGIAFWIAGLPSPVVFGFLTSLAALLPVAGTALVWAPATIALYAQGRPGWALFMLLWGAVLVGSADNFLRPRLISGRAQISTLPVFFGVMGGLAAFGPIGLFVGPLVIALALALIGFVEEGSA
ncbi:MAG TPA: AI-2E family transporter [Thermoanaerobaculia bacterium]|nr:AI-2E family transporter [Thermoanaerobaculia bacterium]